jgi:hypothetical protein
MTGQRKSAVAPILAALAILLLPLVAYVAGYFGLGEFEALTPDHDQICRTYPHDWMRVAYRPAGWLEAKWRHRYVVILGNEDVDEFLPR